MAPTSPTRSTATARSNRSSSARGTRTSTTSGRSPSWPASTGASARSAASSAWTGAAPAFRIGSTRRRCPTLEQRVDDMRAVLDAGRVGAGVARRAGARVGAVRRFRRDLPGADGRAGSVVAAADARRAGRHAAAQRAGAALSTRGARRWPSWLELAAPSRAGDRGLHALAPGGRARSGSAPRQRPSGGWSSRPAIEASCRASTSRRWSCGAPGAAAVAP